MESVRARLRKFSRVPKTTKPSDKLLKLRKLGVVDHAFNRSTQEAKAGRISEFKAILVFTSSSRTARTIETCVQNKQTNKLKKINKSICNKLK